jgi:hypothetical protein
MTRNSTGPTIFDSFEDDLQHDDATTAFGGIIPETDYDGSSSATQKAIDLLLIGIILLSTVIALDCCIRTYFVCKSRKRKRLIAPFPEETVAAVIVNAGTNDVGMEDGLQ